MDEDSVGTGPALFRPGALRHRFHPAEAPPPSLQSLARRRRVPFVAQSSQTDCGAACLAMVLAAFGRHVPVRGIRDAIVGARDGTSAAAILRAAARFGLRAEGVRLELDALPALDLPAILHWDFHHFVVLERWNGRRGRVVDPSMGRIPIAREDLDKHFTGVALRFEPTPDFARSKKPRRRWSRYTSLARSARRAFAALFGLSLALQLLGLALPAATALVIDRVLPRRSMGLLPGFFWGTLFFAAAFAAASWSRSRILVTLQARFSERLSIDFIRHLLDLPFAFFQSHSTGDLMLRLGSNAVLRELLSQQLLAMLFDSGLFLSYAGILLWKMPVLGGGVVLLAAVEAGITLSSLKLLARLSRSEVQAQTARESFLLETLQGIETIKALAAEKRVFVRAEALIQSEILAGIARQRPSAVYQAALSAIHFGSPLLLLGLAAAFHPVTGVPVGAVLGYLALAAGCLAPVGSLLSNVQTLQRAGVHVDRIEEVFTEPREQEGFRREAQEISGAVEFERVRFAYGPLAAPCLREVSFRVEPGEMVAIVGPSGSGKSTLAKLLLGLHRPNSGRVLIDGLDLADLDLASFRRQVGTVLQGGFLFQDTVRRNIALAHPDLSEAGVRFAAERAAVASTIERMPLGYDTPLAEMGSNLSGGQRQRLCIARALAGEPRLVLLDEATSELDTESEGEVHAALETLRATRIVIAHRLSTIRRADRILVLNDGELVEQGTHGSLMGARGLYARLVRMQDALGPAA